MYSQAAEECTQLENTESTVQTPDAQTCASVLN